MPPTLKHRRPVFRNSRFTVYSDHIAANALEIPDFMVVKPNTSRPDLFAGVAVVAVRHGSILLLKHYRHPMGEDVWEVPRGFIEAGEEPAGAARRELAEESGFSCAPKDLAPLGTLLPDPAILQARVALFVARNCFPELGMEEEIGIEERAWHTEPAVYAMLRDGSLVEGATCVALHRYFELCRLERNHDSF